MPTPSGQSVALAAALLAVSIAGAAPARAAGFALFEQGARGMGFAGAFTAQASDPSAIFHNAAGIAFLRGKQIYLGGTLVAPSSTFEGASPFPGEGVTEKTDAGLLIPPSAYYTHALAPDIVAGVGVHVPFGLRSRWANPAAYSGRFISRSAELTGFALNPTLAVKLADRLAVGAGLDLRFSAVKLERSVPLVNPFTQRVVDAAALDLESDMSTGIGFNLGVLARPSETTSVGLAYRHKVKVDYEGAATFTPTPTGNAQLDALVVSALPPGTQPVTTSVTFPAIASVGLAQRWGRWLFEVDVNWYQWSTFDRLAIDFTERPDLSEVIVEDYGDAFQYRFGLERELSETWFVRGGYFWDETPSPPASVSPLLSDSNRHGIALGGTWNRGRLRLDAGTWLVLGVERSTAGVNRDRYEGSYKNRAFTFGLSLGYEF
ncbi:MAG TPA: outer membrane protein transport protein [Vicinamibacteria bacterium]|nr:outer membrane protein transport protein [Vicinamibacteria bacterium]